jgi:small GTP-binding protein
MEYKVVLCGKYNVGKTCLINKYCDNIFDSTQPTLGALYKIIYDEKTKIKIGVWDTAGDERFSCILPIYFKNADIIIYCCNELDSVEEQCSSINEHYSINEQYHDDKIKYIHETTDAKIFIAITKIDLNPNNINIENWAKKHNYDVTYTSSITGEGLNELFTKIFNELSKVQPKNTDPNIINLIDTQYTQKPCCI